MQTGLLGYGKMGRGIFGLLNLAEQPVTVYVRSAEKAEKNNQQIERRIQRALRSGEIDEAGAEQRRRAARFTCDLAELADCDLIVESVTEDMALKIDLLRQVESLVRPEAMVTTNTSRFSINKMAAALNRPGRFGGLHFFHPIQLVTIVELIQWKGIDADIAPRLTEFIGSLKRKLVCVHDGPGSPVNKVLSNYYAEGVYLLEQGLALPSEVDRIAGTFCRIGPCESLDSIGLEFFADSFDAMAPHRLPTITTPTLLRRLVADGRDGRAVGRGIYSYNQDKPSNDAAAYYLEPNQKHSSTQSPGGEEAIRQRLIQALCCGILYSVAHGEGSGPDLSAALADVLVMNFNPWDYMRSRGRSALRAELEALTAQVGPRFPVEGLAQLPD